MDTNVLEEPMTLDERLRAEIQERGLRPLTSGGLADAARAMGLTDKNGSESVARWCSPTYMTTPQTREHIEALARFLRLATIYDLGPYLVRTILAKDDRRRQLQGSE